MDINNIAYLVAGFNPWWMLSLALVLILIDWTLTQTEALMSLGLSLIPIAGLNAINADPYLQLWAYPFFIIIIFFLQRPLYLKLTSNIKSPYEKIDSEIGNFGTLKVSVTEHKGSNHFYNYKNSIEGEISIHNRIDTVIKVYLADGRVFPAIVADENEIKNGEQVKVTGVSNGALVVIKNN